MNLPNKLSLFRIALVPFHVFFLLMPQIPYNYTAALIIFSAASLTDAIDGYIARKYNLITDFGKFIDPLADKILVISAFICFADIGIISPVYIIAVLTREFAVTSVRLSAASGGTVIAASFWGKLKTVSQMIFIIYAHILLEIKNPDGSYSAGLISENLYNTLNIILYVLMLTSLIFVIISGFEYIWKNRKIILENK